MDLVFKLYTIVQTSQPQVTTPFLSSIYLLHSVRLTLVITALEIPTQGNVKHLRQSGDSLVRYLCD